VTPEAMTLGGLTLLLGVYVMDAIPNSNSMALIFLFAGSIATSARVRTSPAIAPAAPDKVVEPRVPVSA
jgi:hypothetical protein